MWVPFNEGWGQYDTAAHRRSWIKEYDPTRLVNNASGWTDRAVGDVHDMHAIPAPARRRRSRRAPRCSASSAAWACRSTATPGRARRTGAIAAFTTQAELDRRLSSTCWRSLHPLLGSPGLSAAVYTQTTDVEIEVNGLMTYDRAVVKLDEARVRAANLALFAPPPVDQPILATSRDTPADWRYTTTDARGCVG